ncbi:MAG: hypothetical protein ACE14V_00505 [bacterium]
MQQRGYVLIIILSLVAIVFIVALSYSGYAHFSLMRGNQTKEGLQTLYLAKSGVEAAVGSIKSKPAAGKIEGELVPKMEPISSDISLVYTAEWSPANSTWTDAISKYGIASGNLYQVTAKGMIQVKKEIRATRTVFALVDISKTPNPIVYWEDLGEQ